VPCASEKEALIGFVRFTTKVSSGSSLVSPAATTWIGLVVCPGVKVTVPLSDA
jgi:hypothetical protein